MNDASMFSERKKERKKEIFMDSDDVSSKEMVVVVRRRVERQREKEAVVFQLFHFSIRELPTNRTVQPTQRERKRKK